MTTRDSLVLNPEFHRRACPESWALSKGRRIEGLLLCTCAEPCPDDRSGSIQYQDKENKILNDGSPIKTFEDDRWANFERIYYIFDSVIETRGFYNCEHFDSLSAGSSEAISNLASKERLLQFASQISQWPEGRSLQWQSGLVLSREYRNNLLPKKNTAFAATDGACTERVELLAMTDSLEANPFGELTLSPEFNRSA